MADEDWAAEVDEQERQITLTGQVSDMPSVSHLENTCESSGLPTYCCRFSLLKTALEIVV